MNDVQPIPEPTQTTNVTMHPQDTSYGNLATGLAIDNHDIPSNINDRVNQQAVIPTAIKGRLSQLVIDDNGVILTNIVYLPSNYRADVGVQTTSNNKGMILRNVSWQIYLDSILPTQKIPQNFSANLFPFYIWDSLVDFDGNNVNSQPGKSVARLQVLNLDSAGHFFIIQSYPRMIVNGLGQSSS